VFGDFILNHTHYRTRRADIRFRIDLTDDLARALEVLRAAAATNPKVLEEPTPKAQAEVIGDSFVEVVLKAWTQQQDHSATKSELIVDGLAALRGEGFAMAYPHQVAVEPPMLAAAE
jgi:small conductance mechanosensitive channel